MFVSIDSSDRALIVEAHIEAMREFRQCPIGQFAGTARHIWHKLCSHEHDLLDQAVTIVKDIGLDAYDIKELHITDPVGITHVIFEMKCEDMVVLDVPDLTSRVLEVQQLLEESGVIYMGWECSDSVGPSSSSTHDDILTDI